MSHVPKFKMAESPFCDQIKDDNSAIFEWICTKFDRGWKSGPRTGFTVKRSRRSSAILKFTFSAISQPLLHAFAPNLKMRMKTGSRSWKKQKVAKLKVLNLIISALGMRLLAVAEYLPQNDPVWPDVTLQTVSTVSRSLRCHPANCHKLLFTHLYSNIHNSDSRNAYYLANDEKIFI